MIFYFGGKFNPFTRGHLAVVEAVLDAHSLTWNYKVDKIVLGLAPIDNYNGIEGCHLMHGDEYRYEMIRQGTSGVYKKFSNLNLSRNNIQIITQTSPSTYEFLKSKEFEERFHDEKVTIVLGDDEWFDFTQSVTGDGKQNPNGKWKYAPEIDREFRIIHFPRNDNTSSTLVKAIFYFNPYTSYADVGEYITENVFKYIKSWHLYWQYGYEDEYRREENLFIKHYDMTKFPRPSATVDMILFRRELETKKMQVLLIRRKNHPYKGYWALPGGFFDVNNDENLEESATRELEEEVGIVHQFKKEDQFRIYSDMGVDPRGRIIDTVFSLGCDSGYARAGDDAADAHWFNVDGLPKLAFNHRVIISDFFQCGESIGYESEKEVISDNDGLGKEDEAEEAVDVQE